MPGTKIILQTQRLLLRELQPSDAADLFALNSDPEVLKYTGDEPFASIAAARQFLKNYHPYADYGYGRWAVLLKTSGAFAGWCGLKHSPELAETDIGFRFFRKYWNMGMATEAARACVDLGFRAFGLPSIVGRVLRENTASIRVLEKIGLQYWKAADFHGQPGLYYKTDQTAWF